MSAYAIGHLEHVTMGPDIIEYLQAIDATLAPYAGRFLIHGAQMEFLEGKLDGHFIAVEFPDLEQARRWYASPAYQRILPLRTANAIGTVFLVQGVPADYKAANAVG